MYFEEICVSQPEGLLDGRRPVCREAEDEPEARERGVRGPSPRIFFKEKGLDALSCNVGNFRYFFKDSKFLGFTSNIFQI